MSDSDEGESTFEALDGENEAAVGPAAILLCGFDREEVAKIDQLLQSVDASEHRIVCCTTTMGNWTVEQALAGDDGGKLLPVGHVPRITLLSGLTDQQLHAVLDSYGSTGLLRPIFAVATPANLGFTVIQLLEELMAERQALERDQP